jgi:hypothetical protein
MLGVAVVMSGFFCVRKEFLRDEDGGGDLSRGDTGHEGVFSPDPATPTLDTLGSLDVEDGSEVGAGCSWGVAAAERARCMAAAEGTVPLWPVILGGL